MNTVTYAKNPIKTLHKNMILNQDGYVWAYYRISPEDTNPNNFEKLERFKENWAKFFRKTLPKYKEFDLFLYPKDKQLVNRFKAFQNDLDKDSFSMGTKYMSRTVEALKSELGDITETDFIMGIRIKDVYDNQNPIESVKRVSDDIADKVLIWLGKKQPIDLAAFHNVQQLEEELFRVIHSRKGKRLSEKDMIYLNRLNYIRNIDHDIMTEAKSIERINDSIVDPVSDVGFIHLRSDNGNSCVSFIPIAEFEDHDISYNHLFHLAQQMDFPCELRIKGSYVEVDGVGGFASKVGVQKRRHKTEGTESLQAGDSITQRTKNNLILTEKLSDEIDQKEPIIRWMACFVVYGKDKAQCKRRGDALMNTLDNLRVRAVRPSAKQLYLFYKMLQGNSIDHARDWIQISNGTTLAEVLFAVTNNVGTNVGWYFGRTDGFLESETREQSLLASRNIVQFNPYVANQGQATAMTDSPHIAITGETGKGKSYLTKMLFFYLSYMKGKVLYIDPKQEMREQFLFTANDPTMKKQYPDFVRHLKNFHYVTLDARFKENHGVLDPIVFLKGVNAKDTAQAMIQSIYNLENKEEVETFINETLDQVIEERETGKKVGLLTVIKRLQDSEIENIKRAGNLLFSKINKSILHLGFSDGEIEGLDLKKRVTILEVAGLDLPEQDTSMIDYSEANKKSVCLMLPLGKFCEQFGEANRKEYTVEIFDEAWIFEKAKGGKQILKSMQRVGRSFCNILVYCTQSVKDLQDDQNTSSFGTVFAFDWDKERDGILQHVGIEVTDRNRKILSNMKKGQCFFKDIYNRVAKITVDCLFPEWDLAMKTVERTASSDAEVKYA